MPHKIESLKCNNGELFYIIQALKLLRLRYAEFQQWDMLVDVHTLADRVSCVENKLRNRLCPKE